MAKRILLPTDFSKNALTAIRYSLDLFASERCSFYLLHAFTVDGFSLEGSPMTPAQQGTFEEEKDRARVQLEKLMGLVRLHPKNPLHSFHAMVTGKDLLFAAKEFIAQKDITAVVLGTKGATDADRDLFGSQASRLMEHINEVPVWGIPPTQVFTGIKHIVLATDYATHFDEETLTTLLELAQKYAADIHVVHVTDTEGLPAEQQRNQGTLQIPLGRIPHQFHTVHHAHVAQGLHTFAADHQADLVVLLGRKQGLFKKLLGRSVLQEMGEVAKIPVVTVHAKGSPVA